MFCLPGDSLPGASSSLECLLLFSNWVEEYEELSMTVQPIIYLELLKPFDQFMVRSVLNTKNRTEHNDRGTRALS